MLKFAKLLSFLLFGAACTAIAQSHKNDFHASAWVDPQIGSVHGRWFFYTPGSLPFGMAKLAPHTNAYGSKGGWEPCGYDNRHGSIEGFGHFHEFQIGGLVVMPTTGVLQTIPGSLDNPDGGYRSRFDKSTERAEPGYYSVYLKDYRVKAELTATERVGYHRYTFPQTDAAQVIVDVGHRQGESSDVTGSIVRLSGKKELEGSIETYPEYLKFCDPGKRVRMYFVIQLNKEPRAYGSFIDSVVSPRQKESKGTSNGMYLTFSTAKNEQIEMRVGLSYTSIDNARKNLQAESAGRSFEAVRKTARTQWDAMLGRIKIEGKDSVDKVKFYTGLYHALLGRGLASDVNGQYPKNDGGIGQIPLDKNNKPRYHHYNTDGIWGAFWNLGQLWALVYPEFQSQYMQSSLDFANETGWLHDGVAAGAHSNGVLTNFFGLMLSATYNSGIRDFDVNNAYEVAYKNETGWRNRPFGSGKYDLKDFVSKGYIPAKDTTLSNGWVFNFGASHTLEFSFSSYGVAQFAKALGKQDDYYKLMRQANYWKNLYDTSTKFIRPRYEDGKFIEDFNPMQAWRGFQEGNAYQYTWYVPQDIAGLMKMLGKDLFNERLEKTFTESSKSTFGGGKEINSFSGLEKLYNHGNQPCLHHAWLFNYSGKPWLTQQWTRAICDEFYGATPLQGYGYGQDEDQGQLGAWYVMAALGLFDVQGHAGMNPTFQFGSPLFDKVTIQLDRKYYAGKELIIEARKNSKANKYIQSGSFNKLPVNNCWIDRSKLTQGGVLTFDMGPQPNTSWGIGTPPPSMSVEPKNEKVTDIWVVFKTHFDLGFTDLPENVFKRYREEMMDNALKVIENNSSLPAEKRFAWTVSGWPLQAQILGPLQTPERKARIEQAIKAGSLVVHGLPFTLHTESMDYEDLVRGLNYSSSITRKYGLPLTISAKMTDVPSHSWIMPTLLNQAGIKFLQLGCNPASQYPRVPELFWWEGADGSKVLCNYTALYGSDIRPTRDWPCKNYLAMQMTGDNHGPPTAQEIDKLLAYAEKELPGVKIHFGTLDDFAKAVLAENPQLPTIKGDCPDTWIHGIQSNPQETKVARNIRPLESALDGLNTQMKYWGIPVGSVADKLAKAYEQSLLYGEHTWGMNAEYGPRYSYGDDWKKWMEEAAAEPVPANGAYAALKNSNAYNTATGSKRKWLRSYDDKRQYILTTNDIVRKELDARLDLLAASVNTKGQRVVVYNPLPWKRSGMIENPWEKGKYFYVKDVAASGYSSFTIDELQEGGAANDEQAVFSTPYFEVKFDLTKGGIASLVERSTRRELVDKSSGYVVGQFMHERFSTHEVDTWFKAYSRIRDGWGLNDLGKPGMLNAEQAPYQRYTPASWKIIVTHTAIADVATLTAAGTDGHAKGYTLTFTFPRQAAYVDVQWVVTSKTPDKQPEGGWLCFPFNVQQPTFTVSRLGGPINPAKDIITGTNRHLMAVNTGVSLTSSDQSGMALTSKDAPLLSLGEPGLWKYSLDYVPTKPAVFVNLYNNMWNTNFPLWQDGSWSESVRIWPVAKHAATVGNLVQYGWETRVPLLTGVADGQPGTLPATKTGIAVSKAGVLITAFGDNPDGEGTLLRLWEQAGVAGNCTVTFNRESQVKAVQPVDLRGNKTGNKIIVKNNAFDYYLGKYSPASFLLEY